MKIKSHELYHKAVKNLSRLKSPVCFRNSEPYHAAIVISEIINNSDKEIRIFDNDLHGDLTDMYPELINSISDFVKKGRVFKIVLQTVTNSNSKIYNTLLSLSKVYFSNVYVKIASPEFLFSLKKDLKGTYYFTIGDDQAFRIQTSDGERKAYCCFNNPKIASRFIRVFDNHFSDCSNVFS